MLKRIKASLKKYPMLVRIKRYAWARFRRAGVRQVTTHNVLLVFPAFLPFSAGSYKEIAELTIQTINQIFPLLASLCASFVSNLTVTNIEEFPTTEAERTSVMDLKKCLDEQGSDKANHHNYHHLYGAILSDRHSIKGIFEVGLGTNNTDVVSNMGVDGRPGASLRAFKSFCPSAILHGADVDKRILFAEERIETFYVDQTNPKTFELILEKTLNQYDLIIDDGLHSANANIATLEFGLKKVKKGGWIVIEDIRSDAIPIWQVVASVIPKDQYECFLLSAEGAIVFAVRRLS